MRALDLIVKKRDKLALTKSEIDFLVDGYAHDEVPDYQMSAWAMAVLLNGMTDQEITDLTMHIPVRYLISVRLVNWWWISIPLGELEIKLP